MSRMIIACAVLSVAAAAVLSEDAQAQIVDYVNNNDGTGNYNFRFQTSNGLVREESGIVVNPGQEDQYIDVQGSYSYIDTNGAVVDVKYSADKDGYHFNENIMGLPQTVVASLLG
ncbi:endocuticle structural glycoprotein SgAbd-5-like isoform X2 [Spodoptera litura]|uniref:Endocuticle structural glycoprotein SgAbd-5-like isoform X2 n=1 Tax=Spodoptera litura TaxID=69820 RepID=A0A9J7DSM4_SPOLT|nr:endocuticle structural glycoprotein SgAbd-5-like isoform X2 [Spodoptera litura]